VIVDAGTLMEAAKMMGTSQPALSRMISTLETRIGMPLFERTSRPLKPTAMGQELSAQGRTIRTARMRAAEFVDFGARGFFGVLKIGAPPFLCQRLVSEALASFINGRPAVRVDLVPDYYLGLQERIFQNQIDLIVGPSKFVDHGSTELKVEPLFTDVNVIVCRSGHPLLSKTEISISDLSDATWVGHSDRSVLRSDMETALKLMGMKELRFAFQSESAGAVMEILRSTDFLTILPRYAIGNQSDFGLSVIPMTLPTSKQLVSTITLADKEESKLVTDFKSHIRSYIAGSELNHI
ncbi:MAG: LysR family transcriptional regulator, partial [Hyphomicrobiales bacterium]